MLRQQRRRFWRIVPYYTWNSIRLNVYRRTQSGHYTVSYLKHSNSNSNFDMSPILPYNVFISYHNERFIQTWWDVNVIFRRDHVPISDFRVWPSRKMDISKLCGEKHRPVTIITAYQVCNKSPRQSGTYTAMSQQDSLLQQSRQLENPWKAFWKDLHALLKEFWNDKHQIILVGDFNKVPRSDQSGIACLCSKFDLIDVFKHHHGSDNIPTYARGLNRRDYCIA